jgi:hypothetical protein
MLVLARLAIFGNTLAMFLFWSRARRECTVVDTFAADGT